MTGIPQTIISKFEERKKLGIFYTPQELSNILCQWAIRDSKDTVFEPSFGGCGFLESSCQRLRNLQNENPIKQMFGCDIDVNAFKTYLIPKYNKEDSSVIDRFIENDFLTLKVDDFLEQGFTTIIGNPPYVSRHKMSERQRESVVDIAKSLKIKLDKRASLWAYFILHSLSFLEENGRMAYVLPGSFLHSNYSEIIRGKITSCFSRSLIIQVGEKLFSSEGTEENTSILLAEGFNKFPVNSKMDIAFAEKLSDLDSIIESWSKNNCLNKKLRLKATYELVPNSILEDFTQVEKSCPVIKLGDVAEISIGIVTGANVFFVINKRSAEEQEISERFQKPIFSKFRMTNGLNFTLEDWEDKKNDGFRCVFIDTRELKIEDDEKLQQYLDSFSEEEKKSNVTFSKRPVWHQPLYMNVPDAFFPYMHNSGPRMILNDAKTLCTNTIHRIFFKQSKGNIFSLRERKLLAISILSTYSQFSAELEGRVYGSGALKIEPGEVKKIKIIFPKDIDEGLINIKFDEINNFLRENHTKQRDSKINEIIREKVDLFLLENCINTDLENIFRNLSGEIENIRKKRKNW